MQSEILRLYVQKKGEEPTPEVKEFIEGLTVREVAKIWSLMGDGGDFIHSLQRVIAVKISKAGGTQLAEGASLEELVKALKEEKERKKREEEEIRRKAKEAEKERLEQEAKLKAEAEAAEKAKKEAEEAAKRAEEEKKKAEEAAKAKAEAQAKRAAQEKAAADAAAAAAAAAQADREAAEEVARKAREELEALEAEAKAAEAEELAAQERAKKEADEAKKRQAEEAAARKKEEQQKEENARKAAERREIEAKEAALEAEKKREEEERKAAEAELKEVTLKITLTSDQEALGLDCLAGAGRVRIIEVSGACERAGVKSASVLLQVDGMVVDSQETLIGSVQKIREAKKTEFEIVVQPPLHMSEEDKEILRQYNAQKDEIMWWANKVQQGKDLKIGMRVMRALDLFNKGTNKVFCEVKLRECAVENGYIVVGQSHNNPQKQTTKTIEAAKNKATKRLVVCEWQEDFVFDVPKDDAIRVSIFGKKAIGKEYLGKVDLVMPELMEQLCQGAFAGRWPVQGQEEGRGPISGDIEIELSLIAVDGNDGSGPDGPMH